MYLQQKEGYYFITQPEEGRISLRPVTAQPMRDCHMSANEKPQHFELPVSANGLFVYNAPPPQLLLLIYKRMFLSFVLWTYLWFTVGCTSQTAILYCSQINPSAVKLSGCFIVLYQQTNSSFSANFQVTEIQRLVENV